MFSATPAKRPRRDKWTETIATMGQTIASALAPSSETASKEVGVITKQVRKKYSKEAMQAEHECMNIQPIPNITVRNPQRTKTCFITVNKYQCNC